MSKQVEDYITTVLRPQLLAFGTSPEFESRIETVVSSQMESALYNWNYDNIRRVLMLLVEEESHFYHPEAPEEIKAFVALTLRNSPLETLQADTFAAAGLTVKLTDEQLISVTSAAINFFRNVDLTAISDNMEDEPPQDIYGSLFDKYFIAWNTLDNISMSEEQRCIFDSYGRNDADALLAPFLSQHKKSSSRWKDVVDGFDSSIDENLYEYVKGIADDKAIFFVDCFKMLSRNPEKVLAVIEYLLAHDAIFLTSNYLLEHTSAEKRRPILKAASSKYPRDDIQKHLSNKTGLEKRHARYLSAVQI